MSKTLLSFVGFGSDTDCDGTGYYACGVLARDEDHAWEVLREDFGGMSSDGVYRMVRYHEAVCEDDRVRGIMERTHENHEWVQGDTGPGDWVSTGARPFRYVSLDTHWAPWAGPDGDDSIGIPALDSTYDEPMAGWDF